ncbi:hypothetical protein [Roseateles noduli]|uniref:hypothetical protein n=1 Tax=Roseateles noduli TaxID=2052484 RepID=UPI003D65DC77
MCKTLSLPFGISLGLAPHGAVATYSRLEREFYVPTNDLGSKAESARIAFEELLCCLARAGFELDSPAGRLAVENAAKAIALKL